MKLVSATIYALAIPFVEAFYHSASARRWCDSIVVRVRDEDGVEGYGEGTPRPYVTGETGDAMVRHLSTALWPAVAQRPLPALHDLESVERLIPEGTPDGVIAANASRAALELAILDCTLRRTDRGVAALLPPRRTTLTYSGVITSGPLDTVTRHARQMRVAGLRDVKIKVGFEDDDVRVTRVREVLGPDATLRLDANGAWTFERAVEVLTKVAPLGIAAVEQPLPRGPVETLAALRLAVGVPIMADESVVTPDDAETLFAARAVDYVNVRVSKCGGLARSAAIAARAAECGVGVQVGSQVGETAILAAAGRHLAAALPDVAFVEGSFGTLLLTEDVTTESVRFGHRGVAPVLTGPGLGIHVIESRLRRCAQSVKEL
jgi:muconate cycloisomerase